MKREKNWRKCAREWRWEESGRKKARERWVKCQNSGWMESKGKSAGVGMVGVKKQEKEQGGDWRDKI